MAVDVKGASRGDITKAIRKAILVVDEATQRPYVELMVENMAKIAAGVKGSPREAITAFGTIIERVDGKVREEIGVSFFDSYPEADAHVAETVVEKFRKRKAG